MKTIGIIGGMSCESTALYYKWLNELVRQRLGGLHSAEILLWSVDFARIEAMQAKCEWEAAGEELAGIAGRLEHAGAQMVLLATNTMHRVAGAIEAAISVPFVHIADATGDVIAAEGLRRPGLLATRYTMTGDFYADRLRQRHGLDVIVPDEDEQETVHATIYNELCKGVIREDSRARYVEIAETLVKRGADSIILGCTEVTLLLNPGNVSVPVFDTTRIHVERALTLAIDPGKSREAA
jgi:amino-acid racemase